MRAFVILRSPTRQHLRRSGYGAPAKWESRYGNGAAEGPNCSGRPRESEQILRFLLR
jgi:hypothetical protein